MNIKPDWRLWTLGEETHHMEPVQPLLASWEKKTHPSQIRLAKYLDEVKEAFTPLPNSERLFLHMEIDVELPGRLLHHYDLENYLTPLFSSRCLPHRRFVLVSAQKLVGGGSRIRCGVANPAAMGDDAPWQSFSMNAGSGPDHASWKQRIFDGLAIQGTEISPAGPMKVRLAWRCSHQRNWTSLWKPTGDAMGPVLGMSNPARPFNPDDDRIVDIQMHVNRDNSIGHDVIVGLWWRPSHNSDRFA